MLLNAIMLAWSWLAFANSFRSRKLSMHKANRLSTFSNTPGHRRTLKNVSLTKIIAVSLRGGEIRTISSLSQVKSIIDEAAETQQLVVLDFTANNCPPCEMIAPIYEDMSDLEEFKRVIFLKVNINDHPEVAKWYGVDGWPTFLLFKNCENIKGIVGGQAAKANLYSLVSENA